MFNNLRNLLVLAVIFTGCEVAARSTTPSNSDSSNPSYTVLLPVNVVTSRRINLQVSVPARFRPVSEIGRQVQEFNVFVTDPYNWSETCVAQTFVGQRKTASWVINTMKSVFMNYAGTVIEELSESRDGYNRHKIIIAYNSPVYGRREVMFMQYFDGPFDCSGFQYAVVVSNYQNLEAAVGQLRNFVSQNCKISR